MKPSHENDRKLPAGANKLTGNQNNNGIWRTISFVIITGIIAPVVTIVIMTAVQGETRSIVIKNQRDIAVIQEQYKNIKNTLDEIKALLAQK